MLQVATSKPQWLYLVADVGIVVLEQYFCRSLGMTLIALAILCVLLTGSVPLTSTFSECEFGFRFS